MTFVQQIQALLKSIFQWWVTIAPWQQGIRVRLGKHVKLLSPGIHFKMPIFDVVYMQAIRMRAQHIQAQTVTTKDGKVISLASALQYQISDLRKMYETLHNAHDTIEQRVQSAIASVIYTKDYADFTIGDIQESVRKELDFSMFGLEIVGFNITSFAVVKTYRLINDGMGHYTGYDQRLDTDLLIGEKVQL